MEPLHPALPGEQRGGLPTILQPPPPVEGEDGTGWCGGQEYRVALRTQSGDS